MAVQYEPSKTKQRECMTQLRLKNKLSLFLGVLILILSCRGKGEESVNQDFRPRILIDSMRISSDSILYRYSFAQSEEYLCIGNNVGVVFDSSKLVAMSHSPIVLDSVREATIFISSEFDLEYSRKPSSFIIKNNKEYNYDRQMRKYWYLVLKDSATNTYYLNDPRK